MASSVPYLAFEECNPSGDFTDYVCVFNGIFRSQHISASHNPRAASFRLDERTSSRAFSILGLVVQSCDETNAHELYEATFSFFYFLVYDSGENEEVTAMRVTG